MHMLMLTTGLQAGGATAAGDSIAAAVSTSALRAHDAHCVHVLLAVCFLVCCVIGICYVAKCACFAKNAQVTAAPPTAVVAERATPMQPMVTLQPQNAKSGSVPTNAPVQVLQPQMLQPQGVMQAQVLVPQQASVRTTQVLVPQQGSL